MTETVTVPLRLIRGDSLVLRLEAAGADWPVTAGWALSMALAPDSGGTVTTIDAVDDGGEWVLTLTTTQSAALTVGLQSWAIRASKSGLRETVMQGTLSVDADIAANTDRRSHARRVLDLIEAAIEGRATSVDLEYIFEDGRSVKSMGHDELWRMRDRYRREVAREEGRGAGARPARIVPRL